MKTVNGPEVTCIAQNDAQLDGLLTLIHQERTEEFGMSSFQVLPQQLPLLTCATSLDGNMRWMQR